MLIGYARVSKDDQETAAQVAALKAVGCERIYHEKASGGRWDRPELHRLLDHLRKGDVLVVWKLDRLSRSLRVAVRNTNSMGPQSKLLSGPVIATIEHPQTTLTATETTLTATRLQSSASAHINCNWNE
jgi:hypothetical protein